MTRGRYFTLALQLIFIILLSCNTNPRKSVTDQSTENMYLYYNYRIKEIDQQPYQESLLELIVSNQNDYGLIIKTPIMLIVDIDNHDTLYSDEIFKMAQFGTMYSEIKYEDSVRDRVKNNLFFDLERYILDSVSSSDVQG